MEQTEERLYQLLIGISKDVGEVKSDVKNINIKMRDVQSQIEESNKEFARADEKISARLEEAVGFMKSRQDSIKDELEVKIGNVRADVVSLDKRLSAMEEKPKSKLWDIFVQFRGLIITAVLVAVVGWCMSFATNLVKAFRPAEPPAAEKPAE